MKGLTVRHGRQTAALSWIEKGSEHCWTTIIWIMIVSVPPPPTQNSITSKQLVLWSRMLAECIKEENDEKKKGKKDCLVSSFIYNFFIVLKTWDNCKAFKKLTIYVCLAVGVSCLQCWSIRSHAYLFERIGETQNTSSDESNENIGKDFDWVACAGTRWRWSTRHDRRGNGLIYWRTALPKSSP